jgi:CBS domain-containing protein
LPRALEGDEMNCEQLMRRDIDAVSPRDNLRTAARKMRDRGVGFLPVVDEQHRPVGTLTDRDIAVRSVAQDQRPSHVRVHEVMSTFPVTCWLFDELDAAERLMEKAQKSRIMCVDKDGILVGVISLSDILEAGQGEHEEQLLRQVAHREAHPTIL